MHLSQQFTAERSCDAKTIIRNADKTLIMRKSKAEPSKEKRIEETYFGAVEPDQIERVEIERRVRAVEDRPSAKLRGGQARDYDSRELGIVAAPVSSDAMAMEER